MAESSERNDKFTVDRLPQVSIEIRRLAARTKQVDLGSEVIDLFETIVTKLETMPLEWGDPEYATKKGGGVVLHGLLFPLGVTALPQGITLADSGPEPPMLGGDARVGALLPVASGRSGPMRLMRIPSGR